MLLVRNVDGERGKISVNKIISEYFQTSFIDTKFPWVFFKNTECREKPQFLSVGFSEVNSSMLLSYLV